LLIARQVTHELEGLDDSIDYHVVPPLCPLIGSPYDFSHTSELIERASATTNAWLAAGGLQRRTIPDQLRAHSHAPA
jgi:NTE family protein